MERRTILLVEDNPDDEELTKRALIKSNIVNQVDVAHDGQEAIDYLFAKGKYKDRDIRDLPVLILLDLKLPKMDGLDVLRAVRAQDWTRLLPVVILTSSKEDEDIIKSYRLGANSYVVKPVDFKQFSEAIVTLGIYWLVLNEPPHLP